MILLYFLIFIGISHQGTTVKKSYSNICALTQEKPKNVIFYFMLYVAFSEFEKNAINTMKLLAVRFFTMDR